MALGTTSALLLAGGAFSAVSQVMGAQTQAKAITRQAEYNAQVYEQQAEMVQQKKKISDVQFARQQARVRSSIVAKTAGKGLMLSGSPLAVMADTESQLLFDKSIQDYNMDIDRNYALSGAAYSRQKGAMDSRLTKYSGYSNAFSTILNTGASIGMYDSPRKAGKL